MMKHNNTQNALMRFFSSRSFLVVSLIIVSLCALGFARAYYQDYKVKQEIKQLEHEVSQLEKKKLDSLDMLKYVVSNEYVEDKARTELNMKKPGEHMVFIQNPRDEDGEHIYEESSTDRHFLSNPVKWLYYFTHQDLPEGSQ